MPDLAIFDLSGKTAVVTGGNRGIGLGISRGLAKAGARIVIWARDEAQCAAAVAELEGLGTQALALACDVSQEDDVVRAASETVERCGGIDICFANAGYGAPGNPLKLSLERWRELMSVNLDGAFLTLREASRRMVDAGRGGKLVAISSITEIFGAPLQAHYAASKGALGGLVRSLAVALARHDIQVNLIQPGWIETDATAPAQAHAVLNETILKRTPARRWGTTADLEGIAVYLASDASRFHTGDSLRVDGGYTVF